MSSSAASGIHSHTFLSHSSPLFSPSLSTQASHFARRALVNCISRIKLVVQEVKFAGPEKEPLSRLYSSLCQLHEDTTQEPLKPKKLLLQAAEQAHAAGQLDLEKILRGEAVANVISKEEWAAASTITLPPYPQKLQDFLAEECTIWPGEPRAITHVVVPCFPRVAIDGAPISFTLDSLNQLDRSSAGPGYSKFGDMISTNIPAEEDFYYAAMTNKTIPESQGYPYHIQQQLLLAAGYKVPSAFNAAMATLWANRRSGQRFFSRIPPTYTRCSESSIDFDVLVGNFKAGSLELKRVHLDGYNDYDSHGIAGWREFRP